MKFFFVFEKEKETKHAWDTHKKNIRELHLELGGDIVTYVRVY